MSLNDDTEWVKDTCKIGQGTACCRYLAAGPTGFECGKVDGRVKAAINARAASMVAQGDNCVGYTHELSRQREKERHGN